MHFDVDWIRLKQLANRLAEPGVGPGSVPESDWTVIRQALDYLHNKRDWEGIIRLRETFSALFARDTVGGLPLLQRLDEVAIEAARQTEDQAKLAHLLGAKGHNLHRQGYHRESIEAFEESSRLYQDIGEAFESLKNYYMTALCHRALGDREQAWCILTKVLDQIEEDNPWRGNPLQVAAWLAQDAGKLHEAESLLTEALELQMQTLNSDILVAGTLADLGEVVGFQGRFVEAENLLRKSLAILEKHRGQYDRQEARTKLKLAEVFIRRGEYNRALPLLNEADDRVRGYGHYYDLLWRIELARAFIYLKRMHLGRAFRKFRVVLRYRQELGLSSAMLFKQLFNRLRAGTGLPR